MSNALKTKETFDMLLAKELAPYDTCDMHCIVELNWGALYDS